MSLPPQPPERASRWPRRLDQRAVAALLAASIIVLLVTIVLFATRNEERSGAPSPTLNPPSASAQIASPSVATASPTPPPSAPGASPAPAGRSAAPVAAPPLPVRGFVDATLLSPGPDGGVYAAIPVDQYVVVALIGTDGAVQPGWPVRLDTDWCTALVTAGDGSLRAACSKRQTEEGLQAPVLRIHGLRNDGHLLPGWPVDVESGSAIEALGNQVEVIVRPYGGDVMEEGDVEPALLAMISQSGEVRLGTEEVEVACCQSSVVPGPGLGYVVNRSYENSEYTSEIIAFGLDGEAWRAGIDGIASDPSFDDLGNAHLSVWTDRFDAARIVVFDTTGRLLPTAADDLPIMPTNGWSGAGYEYPSAPIVAGDGTTNVIENIERTSIFAIDPSGAPRDGWPYHTATGLEESGQCSSLDTGCGVFIVTPQAGPDGTLYVALQPSGPATGGSLIALAPNGQMRPGWPVGLRRPNGQFWDIVVGTDGGVWSLAVEPEAGGYSATLLSIAPDSTVRGRATIVEP